MADKVKLGIELSVPFENVFIRPPADIVSVATSAQAVRMKLIGFMVAFAALLVPAIVARAGALPVTPQVGDTYEITMTRESSQPGSDGSSESSNDRDTIIERMIGPRADGLALEYDLPKATTADERAGNWQFPARVFKPFRGPAQLLNGPELEARVDAWLPARWDAPIYCSRAPVSAFPSTGFPGSSPSSFITVG